MTFRLCLACLLGAALAHGAPLTFKELDFLVRQRTPEADIIREVTQRRLVAPIDAEVAKTLKSSGATEFLIAKLNSPGMTLTPEESRAEWERQALAKQKAVQSLPAGTPGAQPPGAQPADAKTGPDREAVRQMLADKLVRLDGDLLRPVEIASLKEARIFVFYFSSMASADSRRFDPKVLATYQRLKAQYPTQFEVIFVSGSRDEFNMTLHMRTLHMPWPAIRFGAATETIAQHAKGLPWLVPVADTGQMLTKNELGTDRMESLAAILQGVEQLLAKL